MAGDCLDYENGISHEALYRGLSGEEARQFDRERRAKERESQRQHRAFMRGYKYVTTGEMKYHASRYQQELPREEWEGTADSWIAGFKVGSRESNKRWLAGWIERIKR